MESQLLYESQKLTLKNYKFNLKEVLKLLKKKNIEKDSYRTKDELIKEFEDTNDEDVKKFVQFLKLISMPEPMLDIYEYMKKNKITVSNFKIFKILFDSFRYEYDILICDVLLDFIGLDHNQFRTFIEKNKISFSLRSIEDENDESSQDDTQLIFMTFDNFNSFIMKLNSKKSANVRIYFNKIQQIFKSYMNYVKDFQTKEENRVKDVEEKIKDGYIYIATCYENVQKNIFKIGRTNNLIRRLSNYNSGRTDEDEYFYCFYEKVYNVKQAEGIILDILRDFRLKKGKEIVCLNYKYLEMLMKSIIKNINEPYDYINNMAECKQYAYDLSPVIVPKLIVTEDENILKDIKKVLYLFLDECIKENKFKMTKKHLLDNCVVDQLSKKDIWFHIKNILHWQKSKIGVLYKGETFFITC